MVHQLSSVIRGMSAIGSGGSTVLLIAFLTPHCPLTVVKRYREQFSVQGVGEIAIQKKDPMEGGVTHYKEISVLLYSHSPQQPKKQLCY